MKKPKLLSALLLAAMSALPASAQTHQFTVQANKLGAKIQPTMYGIFFEDINFGADGGLYAEMVENRSFEFPDRLMGWNTFGNVSVNDVKPAFERNPHYVTLSNAGHNQKFTGLENRGFFGMGLKKGMKYEFSVYARLNNLQGKKARFRVELVGENNVPISRDTIVVTANKWTKYTATLTSNKTQQKGLMRIFLMSGDAVDLDHVSLFPEDNWNGMRADLVKDLEDLHPGIFRFPGGCIVEGTDLETRYQWKNSVGNVENRPLNENRWNYTFPHRMYPNYYQTYGMGFYEYFLLSEKIGAEPLPVVSVGLACQYQNRQTGSSRMQVVMIITTVRVLKSLQENMQLMLRVIRTHGRLLFLKQIGVGNEQWGEMYPVRLAEFVKQIRAKYPDIKICGSSGPSADGDKFDYGWKEMRSIGYIVIRSFCQKCCSITNCYIWLLLSGVIVYFCE